jgi:acyl-CoA synthetase (NDP forming)
MAFNLEKLLRPKSIAVVGASERADAIGTRVIQNLKELGFSGRIYPINPKYPAVAGLRCFASLSDIPEAVDAAFFGVPAPQAVPLMKEAAERGVSAVFINANGFADGDAAGAALQGEVSAIARANQIAVCGPNNLGLINLFDRVAAWTPRYMRVPQVGPVALVSQSGSVAIVLADDKRQLGFGYLITAGNEAVLGVADYLTHVVADDRVKVVLLYLETIRDPEKFAAAARDARARNKPVIALKLGRSDDGKALVQAHTGSLAGEDRLFSEFADRLGIIRVRDLDEMVETAALFCGSAGRSPPPGLAVVTLSGGEAALIADTASDLQVPLKPLSPATRDRLRASFPPYATIRNPVDAWGLGFTAERFASIVEALIEDPALGTIAMSVDAPAGGGADVPYAITMAKICAAAAARKRFVFFNNLSGTGPNDDVRAILQPAGIPYLSGMRPALAAIGYAIRSSAAKPEAAADPPAMNGPAASIPQSDSGRFRLLREFGIPMATVVTVATAEEAARAAEGLGYPVVLKGAGPTILHKSELGLVQANLRSAAELRRAFDSVAEGLAKAGNPAQSEIYLQKMEAPGVELIVGIRNQPGYGTFVLTGLGGLFVEIFKDSAVRMAPLDLDEARDMLRATAAGKILSGVRAQASYDIDAAARAIVALAQFGAANFDRIASVEVNPLIVHRSGAVGVDLVIEQAAATANKDRP